VGIVAILLLALLMDAVLVLLERLLTPWTRVSAAPSRAEPVTGAEYIAETQIHAGARP
jgi:osmoprotectant transport system permease protein